MKRDTFNGPTISLSLESSSARPPLPSPSRTSINGILNRGCGQVSRVVDSDIRDLWFEFNIFYRSCRREKMKGNICQLKWIFIKKLKWIF